jgi:predicted DNA-binding protein (UPF0251 family)
MLQQHAHHSRKLMRFGLPVLTALSVFSSPAILAAATESTQRPPNLVIMSQQIDFADCEKNSASCGLTAEEMKEIRACEANPEAKQCQLPYDLEGGGEAGEFGPPFDYAENGVDIMGDGEEGEFGPPFNYAENGVDIMGNGEEGEFGPPSDYNHGIEDDGEEGEFYPENEAEGDGEEGEFYPENDLQGEDEEELDSDFAYDETDKCLTDPDFCKKPGPATLKFEEQGGLLHLPVVKVVLPPENTEEHYEAHLRMDDGINFTLKKLVYLDAQEETAQLPTQSNTDPASGEMTAEEVKAIQICEEKGSKSEACQQAITDANKLPAQCDTDPASCDMTAEEVKAIRICEEKGYESETCQQAITDANKLPAQCDTDPASCEMTAEEVKAIRICEEKGYESEVCEQAMTEMATLPAKCDTDPASCEMTAEEVKAIRACEKDPDGKACEQAMTEIATLPAKCDTDPASCEMTAEEVKAIRICENDPDGKACEQAMAEMAKLPAKCDTDPASCEMTAEEVKAIRACEANPEAEACQTVDIDLVCEDEQQCPVDSHGEIDATCEDEDDCQPRAEDAEDESEYQLIFNESDKCKTDPESCTNPGPTTLNFEEEGGTMYLPVVNVLWPNGTEQHYEVRLMTYDGINFMPKEITYLDGSVQ